METFFAPPERSGEDELAGQIEAVSRNAVVDELLHSVGGLLAVLNEHRQILAVNQGLIETLGIPEAHQVLGLRPGEAVNCTHAGEMPGGCGTSQACASCGAAISIVAALTENRAKEASCALSVEKEGKKQDLFFRVRCAPVVQGDRRLLLLFLQDVTYFQRLAALERVFFHDINNMVSGILNAAHLLATSGPEDEEDNKHLLQVVQNLSLRLANEIQIQRSMSKDNAGTYRLSHDSLSVNQVLADMEEVFSVAPLAGSRRLTVQREASPVSFVTDGALLRRVLNNMITNALEATEEGGEVKVWAERLPWRIVFSVWNAGYIPPEIAARIFQRNFSTKAKLGRGYGTYSMKFFGEDILGGKVSFTTSEEEGTTFRVSLTT